MGIQLFQLVLNYSQRFQSAIRFGLGGRYVRRQLFPRIGNRLQQQANIFVRALKAIERRFGLMTQ